MLREIITSWREYIIISFATLLVYWPRQVFRYLVVPSSARDMVLKFDHWKMRIGYLYMVRWKPQVDDINESNAQVLMNKSLHQYHEKCKLSLVENTIPIHCNEILIYLYYDYEWVWGHISYRSTCVLRGVCHHPYRCCWHHCVPYFLYSRQLVMSLGADCGCETLQYIALFGWQ